MEAAERLVDKGQRWAVGFQEQGVVVSSDLAIEFGEFVWGQVRGAVARLEMDLVTALVQI